MIGSFGRKHKSHGKNYGKKDTSKFKKGLVAGGMLLATGAGIWASKGDKETHQEVEYPLVAQDPEADGVGGHNPALASKLEVVGQPIGQVSAPKPAINLAQFDAALNDPKPAKKAKIGAALKLAGEVVAGDAGGKVDVAKKGLDIARGEGEAESTKSVQEQIKAAEKASKGSSLSQIGSLLGLSRGNKTDKKFANVAVAPMIGPVAPPEFFDEPDKSKKDKVKGFFAKGKND